MSLDERQVYSLDTKTGCVHWRHDIAAAAGAR